MVMAGRLLLLVPILVAAAAYNEGEAVPDGIIPCSASKHNVASDPAVDINDEVTLLHKHMLLPKKSASSLDAIELSQLGDSHKADKQQKAMRNTVMMPSRYTSQLGSDFKDMGKGCCVGRRNKHSGKIFDDFVESFEACMTKCLDLDCVAFEYGWGEDEDKPTNRCFLWNKDAACPMLTKMPESCGELDGGTGVHLYKRGYSYEKQTQDWPARRISFITIYDDFFDANLGRSSLWQHRSDLPHEWIVVNNTENMAISKVYAQAQRKAINELLVFVHSDVFLPDDFYVNFMRKLKKVEDMDANWGVLGTAGVASEEDTGVKSSIEDPFHVFLTGVDNVSLQSFDEHLLVLRKFRSPTFDDRLPGFDLYGTDIALLARKAGQKSYLLNVPVLHKVISPDGTLFNGSEFQDKIHTPEFTARAERTIKYFQDKWCAAGALPITGSAFHIECDTYELGGR